MKKNSSSVSLFREPVPYETKEPHLCKILVPVSDGNGVSSVQTVCIEQHMSEQVPLDYQEATLSNLVDKGVEPHSLDMIDSNKLGIDSSVDALASHISNNASDFINSPKSE